MEGKGRAWKQGLLTTPLTASALSAGEKDNRSFHMPIYVFSTVSQKLLPLFELIFEYQPVHNCEHWAQCLLSLEQYTHSTLRKVSPSFTCIPSRSYLNYQLHQYNQWLRVTLALLAVYTIFKKIEREEFKRRQLDKSSSYSRYCPFPLIWEYFQVNIIIEEDHPNQRASLFPLFPNTVQERISSRCISACFILSLWASL